MTTKEKIIKFHYFCLAFVGKSTEESYQGQTCNASIYMGYEDKKITKARIEECKQCAGVDKDSVLIACSYLGFMSNTEMTGKD